jgi:hypothetical protein
MAVATPADHANPHPMAQPGPRTQLAGGYGFSGIAADIVQRTDVLAERRIGWERDWRDLADFCLPTASRQMAFAGQFGSGAGSFDRLIDGPATRDASRRRFDSTTMTAIDRLAAGMESLVTPQSEKWHGLDVDDPLAAEATDEEKQWFERVRDKQFAIRYEPRAGFVTANQKAIRSAITFGTGVMFVEESFGLRGADPREVPVLYRHIPLSQSLIDINAQGEPDTFHRRFTMTARQAMQRFGDKVSVKVKEAADDPKKCDTPFTFIHAVTPREEAGGYGSTNRKAPFASYYVEQDTKVLIGESGFFEFPYIIYYWLQSDESAYGESPTMLALDDIRGLNVTRKTALRAMQQWTDPPIAVAHDGVMNRPNMNPRAVNFGAIDGNGRMKIQPIITAQNPSVVQEIIESERNGIKEMLYNNLFQILIQNPQMTATEAMLRANEKGELLGPSGSKIQSALSRMIDREFGILERKGAFDQGASLEAPESLHGRKFGPRFTSPLDRLRQGKEGAGIMQAYQAAGQIAAVRGDPSIFDNFDDDKALKIVAEVNGAPQSIMRTKDEIAQLRQQRAQQLQQQKAMQMAQQGAAAAKDGAAAASDGTNAATGLAGLAGLLGGPGASQAGASPVPLPALAPPGVPA